MTLRAHEQCAGASAGDDTARDLYFNFANTGHAIRFCPACLAERQPYYRLEWRLAFVTVCARHRLPLEEKCDYCKAPCLFANAQVSLPLGLCHRCHKHLAYMAKDLASDMALHIELQVEFQQNVLNLLRKARPVG